VLIALFGVCAILIAFGMALEAVSLFFMQHGHIFLRILAGLQWGLGGVSIAAIGLAFWKFALRSGFHQVRFEADGGISVSALAKNRSRQALRGTKLAQSPISCAPTITTFSSREKTAVR